MCSLNRSIILLAIMAVSACTQGPESPRGFSLPEGNYDQGQAIFAQLECNSCHSAAGADQLDPDNAEVSLALGGASPRVTTYAELMTSIINPSHRLSHRLSREKSSHEGQSLMKNYNDVMTVQQLIDLVAFLQPQYKVIVITPSRYRGYYSDRAPGKN
jgi:mono/diheme cytochrome c family protein